MKDRGESLCGCLAIASSKILRLHFGHVDLRRSVAILPVRMGVAEGLLEGMDDANRLVQSDGFVGVRAL